MGVLEHYAMKSRAIKVTSTKTRPADASAYVAGDVIGTNDWVFDLQGDANAVYLIAVALRIDINALPSGMGTFKLHLYDDVTAVQLVDNAPQTYLDADKGKYLMTVQLDAVVDKGDYLFCRTTGIFDQVTLKKGASKLYGRLETDAGYTPSSGTVYNLSLIGVGI